MTVMERFANAGVVPVVVLEDAKDAVPTANAMVAGGIDLMEITFRTAAAADSIKAVAENCPDMLVGAGTVLNLEQCKTAIEMGAKFIVSPGFNEKVVDYCIEHDVPVAPGCVTPTEITAALEKGLKVIKFFPANVYGGLNALKNLSAPFVGVKFMPTGGVNAQNVGEFIRAPFIHAVGGSWVCPKDQIAAGNFEKITQLCAEARQAVLGFEIAHVGINSADESVAAEVAEQFENAFGFAAKAGNSSIFSSSEIEVMKQPYLGKQGHLAIRTNSVEIAAAELVKKGYTLNMETAKYKNGRMTVVYLEQEIGGFAIHLLQK